eukprot:TRINITY_DN18955_c0_g1_i1.p1 TRINITY_DN18955_c0_g1~~TRINITY_DN18955_c0_g1_i1.p1  ORF type:complete len:984 (-),score=280.49 TRINITY_DN18955_c0_g1_i1:15-2909(-)
MGGRAVVSISINYYGWILLWLSMPLGLVGVWFLLDKYLGSDLERSGLVWSSWINRVVLCILELLYLPWAFTVGTVYFCTKQANNTLTTDSAVVCWSGPHSFLLILVTLVGTVYLLGFPLMLAREIHHRLVYDDPRSYDKFIRLREFEWMVGLEESWSFMHIYTVSSYKRHWVYYKPLNMLHKLVFVFWYHMLYDMPTNQNLMMFITLLLPSVYQLFRLPFRRISSNVVHHFYRWTLIVMAFMAQMVLRDVRSPLLVASVHYIWLWFFACVALGTMAVVFVGQIVLRKTWQTTKRTVRKTTADTGHYIDAIFAAREVHERLSHKYVVFADPSVISDQITVIDEYRRKARKEGLMVEGSLDSILEDLVVLYNYIHQNSILPFPPLESALPHFRQRLDAREYDMLLVPPEKRRMLLKLLCIRAWFNGRKIKKMPGDPANWPQRDAEETEVEEWDYEKAEKAEEEAKKAKVLKEIFEEDKNEMEDVDSYLMNLGVRRPPVRARGSSMATGGAALTPPPQRRAKGHLRTTNLEAVVEEDEDELDSDDGRTYRPSPRAPAASPDIEDARHPAQSNPNDLRFGLSILQQAANRRRPGMRQTSPQMRPPSGGRELEDLDEFGRRFAPTSPEPTPALVDERVEEEERERQAKQEAEAARRREEEEEEKKKERARAAAQEEEERKRKQEQEQEQERASAQAPADLPPLAPEPSSNDRATRERNLQRQKIEIRNKIKAYEKDFEERTGHAPTHKDKRNDQQLYQMYMEKKRIGKELDALAKEPAPVARDDGNGNEAAPQLKSVPKRRPAPPPAPAPEPEEQAAAEPARAGEDAALPGAVADKAAPEQPEPAPALAPAPAPASAPEPAPAADSSAPAASEGPALPSGDVPNEPEALTPFTKQLLKYCSSSDDIADKDAALSRVHETRVMWKKLIRKWDKDFEAVNGTAPTNKDKQSIKPWYMLEKKLKAAHAKLSE